MEAQDTICGHLQQSAALDEAGTNARSSCPCTNTNTARYARRPPVFVSNDYFCDTGSAQRYRDIFYGDNPLWDGAGCGPLNTCCSFNNPPWFYKQLPQPTTDDIEMRVCRDEGSDEDIALESAEYMFSNNSCNRNTPWLYYYFFLYVCMPWSLDTILIFKKSSLFGCFFSTAASSKVTNG